MNSYRLLINLRICESFSKAYQCSKLSRMEGLKIIYILPLPNTSSQGWKGWGGNCQDIGFSLKKNYSTSRDRASKSFIVSHTKFLYLFNLSLLQVSCSFTHLITKSESHMIFRNFIPMSLSKFKPKRRYFYFSTLLVDLNSNLKM
jgi:hypothetical protein